MLDGLIVSSLQRRTLEQATATFEQNLYDAKDFLSARGISEAVARGHRLGATSDSPPVGYERFANMMSLPYLTPTGVVAIKFRALDPERKPKYDAPSGQQVRLYNVAALHTPGDVVAVCEGELDALVMSEIVGIPAVGVPGASNWQDHWVRCFADYETVLVIADNDQKEDGSNPGLKHAEKVVKKIPGARLVKPPAGADLNDWVLDNGVEAVRNACGV